MNGAASVVLRGLALDPRPRVLAGVGLLHVQEVPRELSPEVQAAFEAGRQQGIAEGLARGRAERHDDAAQLEQALASAQEEGRAAGLRQGLEEAAQQLDRERKRAEQALATAIDQSRARTNALAEALMQERAAMIEAAEDDIVALVHAAVCRILGAEALAMDRVREVLRPLVRDLAGDGHVQVHVHPADFELLQGAEPQGWAWVADAAVQLGGAVLRSSRGHLDARLETQLLALSQALLTARHERSAQLRAQASAHAEQGA
jgi:flagellar assembly protein FliH